jgi:hypothetical protein
MIHLGLFSIMMISNITIIVSCNSHYTSLSSAQYTTIPLAVHPMDPWSATGASSPSVATYVLPYHFRAFWQVHGLLALP